MHILNIAKASSKRMPLTEGAKEENDVIMNDSIDEERLGHIGRIVLVVVYVY